MAHQSVGVLAKFLSKLILEGYVEKMFPELL